MKVTLPQQILIVTLCKLLLNIGRRFVYPFAPVLSRNLEVPLTTITSIIAVSQFSSLIGIISGPLADRLGYKCMMLSGLALLAAGMFFCGVSPVYWIVMLGLLLASFGKILFDPAILGYIGKNVEYSRRARVIGISETSWAGSTLIGIPLLGLSIEYLGLNISFLILAVLSLGGWLAIQLLLPADQKQPGAGNGLSHIFSSLLQLLRIRTAVGMLLFGFWVSFANDSLFVVYGAWFEKDFNVSLVSLGFSTVAIGLAELIGESCTAFFSDRLGLKKAVIIGLVLAIASYLLLPLIGVSLLLAMAALFLVFCTYEFTIVSSFSLSTELVPASRATMMAGFYAAAGLGRMSGVIAGGFLWKAGGIAAVSWFSAALTGLGLVSLLWGLRYWKRSSVA